MTSSPRLSQIRGSRDKEEERLTGKRDYGSERDERKVTWTSWTNSSSSPSFFLFFSLNSIFSFVPEAYLQQKERRNINDARKGSRQRGVSSRLTL